MAVSAARLPMDAFTLDERNLVTRVHSDGIYHELAPGGVVSVTVNTPGLEEREAAVRGDWRGILSVDIYGKLDPGNGRVILEVLDPATGEVLGTNMADVAYQLPAPAWTINTSSARQGNVAEYAFDGDTTTAWRTPARGDSAAPPHWVGMEFAQPVSMSGIRHHPPVRGGMTGVVKEWKLEVRRPGADWETAAEGETTAGEARQPLEVTLPEAVMAEAFRFVVLSDHAGRGQAAIGHLEPLGFELSPKPSLQPRELPEGLLPVARAWVELPAKMVSTAEGVTLGLRLRNSPGAALALGQPHYSRIHTRPTGQLFGRSNGGKGPDKLGAGLLGFVAITEHEDTVLTVLEAHSRSAASRVRLRAGDGIVAVGGLPLPVNCVEPGWRWFNQSHEATIGRRTEAALAAGERTLPVSVIRDGEIVDLAFPLSRTRPFTTMDPATDPEAEEMLKDIIGFLVKNQNDDGSWSGCMIRTTLASLALMATEDSRHRPRVRRAVNWAQDRFKSPGNYGNLGFWNAGFAGILYSEWHLSQGDRSVVRNVQEMLAWAYAGQHTSSWGVPALGHGPSGLPYDNKGLVAPACHILVAEALARRFGVESSLWDTLMPYMEMAWSNPAEGGHGALGYNRSARDQSEFWSRTGLFAMAALLRGDRPDMSDAMIKIMRERHPWLRNSHAYGEPGGALGLLALNLADGAAFIEILREYSWWFSLAWEPGYGLRFTQPHMGAPYMGEDDLINAAYALVLQANRRNLHITGASHSGSQ